MISQQLAKTFKHKIKPNSVSYSILSLTAKKRNKAFTLFSDCCVFHKIFAISSRSTSETIGILLIGDFPICWSMSAVWFDSRKPRQNDPTFGEESAPAPQTHEILKILQCRNMKLELEQKFYWICNNSYVFVDLIISRNLWIHFFPFDFSSASVVISLLDLLRHD